MKISNMNTQLTRIYSKVLVIIFDILMQNSYILYL